MEAWSGNTKKSALVEANLIHGGSLELTFATTSDERHENAYVRVFYPGVSVMSRRVSLVYAFVMYLTSKHSAIVATIQLS